MHIGTEHATPIGIAMTASEGVKYDFTTITLNGRKIRALDTRRLTVFELCSLGGIKPEQLMARSGRSLGFTLNGERITLRGTASVPSEISLNGRECSLNSPVRKGDEVNVVPAKPGEDAAALLSDYTDVSGLFSAEVTVNGKRVPAGDYILVNGAPVTADMDIENGAVITSVRLGTLGALLNAEGLPAENVLLNGQPASPETKLSQDDEITCAEPEKPEVTAENAPEKPESGNIPIVFNGEKVEFPAQPGSRPIFLDILAAFADDPTELLSKCATVTINGRTARLDEPISPNDEIVIR